MVCQSPPFADMSMDHYSFPLKVHFHWKRNWENSPFQFKKEHFNRITFQNACMVSFLFWPRIKTNFETSTFYVLELLPTGQLHFFYWILVFHIMRKHFVLFVPKLDVTRIWFFFQLFISLYSFSVEFIDGRNSSVDWITKIQFRDFQKTVPILPPQKTPKDHKQTKNNWKRK